MDINLLAVTFIHVYNIHTYVPIIITGDDQNWRQCNIRKCILVLARTIRTVHSKFLRGVRTFKILHFSIQIFCSVCVCVCVCVRVRVCVSVRVCV